MLITTVASILIKYACRLETWRKVCVYVNYLKKGIKK